MQELDPANRLRKPPPGRAGVFTAGQVAARLSVTTRHIVNLIEEGKIAAINVATKGSSRNCWRITFEAYLEYLDTNNYG